MKLAELGPEAIRDLMQGESAHLVQMLKTRFLDRTGFALFLFDFGPGLGALTSVSNAQREDMATAMLEWLNRLDPASLRKAMARFEAQQHHGPEAGESVN